MAPAAVVGLLNHNGSARVRVKSRVTSCTKTSGRVVVLIVIGTSYTFVCEVCMWARWGVEGVVFVIICSVTLKILIMFYMFLLSNILLIC